MLEGIALFSAVVIWIIICYTAYCKTKRIGMSVCISSIVWLFFLFIITEGLSITRNLTSNSVSLCWIGLGIGTIAYLIYSQFKHPTNDNVSSCVAEVKTLFHDMSIVYTFVAKIKR